MTDDYFIMIIFKAENDLEARLMLDSVQDYAIEFTKEVKDYKLMKMSGLPGDD